MYVDPIAYQAILLMACIAPALCFTSAIVLLRSRRVGGLTFCRIGRFGFSFYITRS